MESSPIPSSLVAATLIVSFAGLGLPSLSRAADVPTPTLVRAAIVDEAMNAARVELRVNADDLGEGAEPMAKKIAEVGGEVFDAEGIAAPSDPLDPVVIVVVERTGTEENPGFIVGFSIEKGDEIVPGSTRQTDCSLCTRGELIDKIEAELPALLELARAHQVPVETGGGEGGEEGSGEGGEDGGSDEVAPIGPLGFGGIGLGVAGVVGVGVGAAFAARGVVPEKVALMTANINATDYRTPGLVVLSVGAAALVGGIVMIAVDVSKRKKARSGNESAAKIEPYGAGFAF